MIFLLVRFLPYFIPLTFFGLAKATAYYPDYWLGFLVLGLALTVANFILLKLKNRQKPILGLMFFAVTYYLAGLAYFLVLENPQIINIFLVAWSLIFWLYLEAVFHEFYETNRTHIINLQNVSLYANILIIFFLTSSLISFYIFLNWSEVGILLMLGLSYLIIINFALTRQKINRDEAWIYSSILALILIEILTALMYLPTSFYVAAAVVSLIYYLLSAVTLAALKNQLTSRFLWRYIIWCTVVALAIFLTAAWT